MAIPKPIEVAHSASDKPAGKNRQRGFGLLEMAIVLCIVGLLLGGSLRGSEIINTGQVKSLTKNFQNAQTWINSYQDKFRARPGDDPKAIEHLGSAALAGDGNGIIDGHWYDTGATSEASRVWQHFRLAGLMVGPTDFADAEYQALSVLGYPIGIQSGTGDPALSPIRNGQGFALPGTFVVCSRGIPGRLALALDVQLDDGSPATGNMLATRDTGSSYALGAPAATLAAGAPSDIQLQQVYIVCLGV